jgi:hypothetical protein
MLKAEAAMLSEFVNLRQNPTGYRRLFTDAHFDLYLWYDKKGGALTGFQLCYSKEGEPHALTCRNNGSCTHEKIDEGESGVLHYKGSPILMRDGEVDRSRLLADFLAAAGELELDIRDLVAAGISG